MLLFFLKNYKKNKKLALTSFYCPTQKTQLGDSWKLICLDQSRFKNFSYAEDFKRV